MKGLLILFGFYAIVGTTMVDDLAKSQKAERAQALKDADLFHQLRKINVKGATENIFKKISRVIAEGANVDATDPVLHTGRTPLHYAASEIESPENVKKTIEFLIENNADTSIKDNENKTPFDLAQSKWLNDYTGPWRSIEHLLATEQSPTHHQIADDDAMEEGVADNNQRNDDGGERSKKRPLDDDAMDVDDVVVEPKKPKPAQTASIADETYDAGGTKNALHGTIYQLKMLMRFVERGTSLNYKFRLATEMNAAEKFDDLMFNYIGENGESRFRFMQIKHRQERSKPLTESDLLNTKDGDYSLKKYFESYRRMLGKPEFKGEHDDYILLTNIDFDEKTKAHFTELTHEDKLLDIATDPRGKRYKFSQESTLRDRLVGILLSSSDLNDLAEALSGAIFKGKEMNLVSELYKKHHRALAGEHIIDPETKTLHADFILNRGLSDSAQVIRAKLEEEMNNQVGHSPNELKQLWEGLKTKELTMNDNFGRYFKLEEKPKITDGDKLAKGMIELIDSAKTDTIKIKFNKSNRPNYESLAGHVFVYEGTDKRTVKFSADFLAPDGPLPQELRSFKKQFLDRYGSMDTLYSLKIQMSSDYHTCEDHKQTFVPQLPNDTPTDNEINGFFEHITIATGQPSEMDMDKVIQAEFGDKFNAINTQHAYHYFYVKMLDWMKQKTGVFYTREKAVELFRDIGKSFSTSIWSKIGTRNDRFTGRTKELRGLHHSLMSTDNPMNKIVITGMGGIGKTQLAKEYAQEYGHAYTNVVFINAESAEQIEASFMELAKDSKLGIPMTYADGSPKEARDVIKEVYEMFESEKTLIIFDNAEKRMKKGGADIDLDSYLPAEFLPPHKNSAKVIITSRNTEWDYIRKIPLDALTENDAKVFIRKSLKMKKPSNVEIKLLIEKLQRFPLALQQAVAYINYELENTNYETKEEFSIKKYLELFDEKAKQVLDYNTNDPYEKTTYTTWEVTMDAIRKRSLDGSKNSAQEILNIMAYLHPDNIPSGVFSKLKGFSKALNLLQKYSMIDGSNSGDHGLNIHRLVQKVARTKLQESGMAENALRETITLLNDNKKVNADHFVAVWEHALKYDSLVREFGDGISKTISSLIEDGRYNDALKFAASSLEPLNKMMWTGDNNEYTLKARIETAKAMDKLGQHEDAHTTYDNILGLWKQEKLRNMVPNPDEAIPHDLFTLNVLKEKANVLRHQGQYKEAKDMLQKIYNERKHLLGERIASEDSDTWNTQIDLAKAHLEPQQIKQRTAETENAEKILKEVYNNVKKAHKSQNMDAPDYRRWERKLWNTYASCQFEKGDYVAAIKSYEAVLAYDQETRASNHLDVLTSRYNVANAQYANTNRNSVETFQQIYRDTLDALGPSHPQTRIVSEGYANALERAGHPAKAIDIRGRHRSGSANGQPEHAIAIPDIGEGDAMENVHPESGDQGVDTLIQQFSNCMKPSRRRRRSVNCRFTADDNDKIIGGEVDAEHPDKLRIDGEKLLNENGHDSDLKNKPANKPTGKPLPIWKRRVIGIAGKVGTARAIHGTIVACRDGSWSPACQQSSAALIWSMGGSEPIEKGIIKVGSKLFRNVKLARGLAGVAGSAFDIVDIVQQSNILIDCSKREGTKNPCSEKEVRDAKVSLSISAVSLVAGIIFTIFGMPFAAALFGLFAMLAQIAYSGWSETNEYRTKYKTIGDENWDIAFRTMFFIPLGDDINALVNRTDWIDALAQSTWGRLNETPNNVKAYGTGIGELGDKGMRSSYAKMMLNTKDADHTKLSRVIPADIANAIMICLPQNTHDIYEKGVNNNVPSAVHYCENAMVMADSRRSKMGDSVILNMEYVNSGEVAGSSELKNIFMIFKGSATMIGGDHTTNRFMLFDPSFQGRIIGGFNATNILFASQSKDLFSIRFSGGSDEVMASLDSSQLLVNDQFDTSVDSREYYYAGRAKKRDHVTCSIEFPEVLIDSGGGVSNTQKDIVENCRKLFLSPFTEVTGADDGKYNIYIKTDGYNGTDLHSTINIERGTVVVFFPEAELIGPASEMIYSAAEHAISVRTKFGKRNENLFSLEIRKFVHQNSTENPVFALFDKHGSNIVPRIPKSAKTSAVKLFDLHASCAGKCSADDFESMQARSNEILNANKGYQVISTIKDEKKNKTFVFGSQYDDVIYMDAASEFARGGGGKDVYIIDDSGEPGIYRIDNKADDNELDAVFMEEIPAKYSIKKCDLLIETKQTIIVENYLQSPKQRHIIFVDKKGDSVIALTPVEECSSSTSYEGELTKFIFATPSRNLFILPKDSAGQQIVIHANESDLRVYKDNNDLLIERENLDPFIIKIEEFFVFRKKWEQTKWWLYNKNDLARYYGVIFERSTDYNDKIDQKYSEVFEEYERDLSYSDSTRYNHQESKTDRIGILILKNISPRRIKVAQRGANLVFIDRTSNNEVQIKDWDANQSHRASLLEFDIGSEPISIHGLERFSLKDVDEVQSLIDKAAENYENQHKFTLADRGIKCLISIDGFIKQHSTYECLGFFLIEKQIDFLENYCSPKQIISFKENATTEQVLAVLHKLHNDVALNGYSKNVSDYCSSELLLSQTAKHAQDPHENTTEINLPNYLLYMAVRDGRLDVVKDLIGNNHANPKVKDDDGRTPLHWAAISGQLDIVKYLASKHYAPSELGNYRDLRGRTPAYLADERGHDDVVQYFESLTPVVEVGVKCLVPIGRSDEQISTHRCVACSSHERQAKFIQRSCNRDHLISFRNKTTTEQVLAVLPKLLRDVVLNGNPKNDSDYCSSKMLLSKSVPASQDPQNDFEDNLPNYLLYMAVRDGRLDVVRNLIGNNHTSPKLKDEGGRTPLHWAAISGQLDIVKYLATKHYVKSEFGNYRDLRGRTPAYLADEKGHDDVVQYFESFTPVVEVGIKCLVSIGRSDEQISTHRCVACPSHERQAKFVQRSCNRNQLISFRNRTTTAQVLAALPKLQSDVVLNGNPKNDSNYCSSKLLLSKSASVAQGSSKTAHETNLPNYLFYMAVRDGRLDVVKYLIQGNHTSPKVKDDDGRTPLHWAAISGQLDIVKYLASKFHAPPELENCRDPKGRTPAYLADEQSHDDVVQYFESLTPVVEVGVKCLVSIGRFHEQISTHRCVACPSHERQVKFIQRSCNRDHLILFRNKTTTEQVLAVLAKLQKDVVLNGNPKNDSDYCSSEMLLSKSVPASQGPQNDFEDNLPNYLLYMAVRDGRLDVVRNLIGNNHTSPKLKDEGGRTPLHWAAKNGKLDIVKYLVSKSPQPFKLEDYRDYMGQTPADSAEEQGHDDVVQYFESFISSTEVSVKCLVSVGGPAEHSTHQCAGFHSRVKQMEFTKKYCTQEKLKMIFRATTDEVLTVLLTFERRFKAKGNSEKLNGICSMKLLRKPRTQSEDPHENAYKTNLAMSLLYMAVRDGRLDVVKYLFDGNHVKAEYRDEDGRVPLSWAAKFNKLDIAMYLVRQYDRSWEPIN